MRRLAAQAALAATLAACSNVPAKLRGRPSPSPDAAEQAAPAQQGTPETLVPTTEVDGVILAKVPGGQPLTQVVRTASSGRLVGAELAFPPGTLAADVDLRLEEARSLATPDVAKELGIAGAFGKSSTAILVTPATPVDALLHFTVALPLPETDGLELEDPYANLVVLFHVAAAPPGVVAIGIIPRALVEVTGRVVRFRLTRFGAYQAAYTEQTIASPIDAVTTREIR